MVITLSKQLSDLEANNVNKCVDLRSHLLPVSSLYLGKSFRFSEALTSSSAKWE